MDENEEKHGRRINRKPKTLQAMFYLGDERSAQLGTLVAQAVQDTGDMEKVIPWLDDQDEIADDEWPYVCYVAGFMAGDAQRYAQLVEIQQAFHALQQKNETRIAKPGDPGFSH